MAGFLRHCTVLILMLATARSFASFDNANDLKNSCDQDRMNCMQYVKGVMDGTDAAHNSLYCWPENATLGQATDIVAKWLRENPEVRTMPAGAAVLAALKEAFPLKIMWQPPQENSEGEYVYAPPTLRKSSDDGKWIGTCSQNYVSDFGDFILFWMNLPENYEYRDIWWNEYFQ